MKRLLQITILAFSFCLLAVAGQAEESAKALKAADHNADLALSVIINVGDATCNGASDGILMAVPDGGLPPYTYLWSTGATTQMVTGVPVGIYSVTVTDALSNTATATATVGESDPFNVVLAATYETGPGCMDGKVDVIKAELGDSGPYTYEWSTGSTHYQITDLPAGIYCVTVTNAFGCTGSGCIEVEPLPGGFLQTNTTATPVTCPGGNDGTATVSATGGVIPYTYAWSDPAMQTTPTAINLSPGKYYVTVSHGGACPGIDSVIITAPDPIDIQSTITPADCNLSNGAISLTVSGGTAPYSYAWSPSLGNTANPTNLMAGTYTATVTDSNGCTAETGDLVIGDNCVDPPSCTDPVVTSVVVIEGTCGNNDAEATINVAGGPAGFSYDWTPNVSMGHAASNLAAGTYTVVITDLSDAACNTSETFTVGVQDGPDVEILSTTPATCQENNGTAVLGPIGLTYEWCNGYVGNNPINLPAGECQVTITDAAGCVDVIEVVIEEFVPLMATPNITQQPDCNMTNGAVTITVSGGSFNYTYEWSDGGMGASRTDLAPGAYCVTVTDNGPTGCVTTTCFVLSATGGPTVDADSPVLVDCRGDANGTVQYTVTPNDPSYVVVITDANGVVYNNGDLAPGNYCLSVLDGTGCTIGGDCFEVVAPDQIDVDVNIFGKDCIMNGAIELVEVKGGNGSYTYAWTGPGNFSASTRNISDLNPGAYTVTVTDAKGCSVTITALVVEDLCDCDPPVVTSVVVVEADCNTSNGRATINVSGNVFDYTFSWSPSVSLSNQAFNIPPGIYTVRIEDRTDPNCFIIETFTVGASDGFDVQVATVNASCNTADGSVTLTPADLEYRWEDGFVGADRNDLAGGTYFIEVTNPNDTASCVDFITVVLEEDNPLMIEAIIDQKPSCQGTDGIVTLLVSGGSNDYTYSWSSNSATQSNLPAGIYEVEVTDNVTGCAQTIYFTLTEDVPSATLNINPIVETSCTGLNDATIDLSSLTTEPGFIGPAVITIEDVLGNVYQSGDIPPGNYCALIRDANGCLAGSACFSVKYPAQIDVDISVEDKDCDGLGSITLEEVIGGTGAYNFDWSDITPSTNDPQNRDSLDGGSYTIIVSDDNGCAITETLTIEDNSVTITATADPDNVSCTGNSDGSISIVTTGGNGPYIYDWEGMFPDTATIDSLPEGTYNVIITDANGCSTGISDIEVSADNDLSIQSINSIDISCLGLDNGSITIIPSGGTGPYTYDWEGMFPDTATIDSLPEGTYEVIITDALGCTVEAGPIDINTQDSLVLQSITPTNISCLGNNDGSVEVILTGGTAPYTYDWGGTLPDTAILNDLPEGSYEVTITDAMGCSAIAGPVALDTDNELEIQLSEDTTACAGMLNIEVLVSSTTDAQINWTDNAGNINIIDGTSIIEVPVDGEIVYYVEVISGACVAMDTVEVTEFELNPMVLPEASACIGDGVQLNPGGSSDFVYSWSPADELVDATVPSPEILTTSQGGIFTAIIYDPAKPECTVTREVDLTVNDLPSVAITGDTVACAVEELQLQANSNIGNVFEWSETPDFTDVIMGATYAAMVGQPGEEREYFVRVTDSETGCSAESSIALNNFAVRVTLGEPVSSCQGTSIRLNPQISLSTGEILDFEWSAENATIDTSIPEEPIVSADSSTMVIATIENNFGCSFKDSIDLTVIEIDAAIQATATPDTIAQGQSSQLNVSGNQDYEYLWTPSTTLNADDIQDPLASPMETTQYSVEIVTEEGCTDTRSVQVVVLADCANSLFFPNAFTPNNDGRNDVLFLRGALVDEVYFAIYNRWGEKVFESNDITSGWDGTYQGKQLPPDVFGYYLRVTCIDGEDYYEQGNVSLLR